MLWRSDQQYHHLKALLILSIPQLLHEIGALGLADLRIKGRRPPRPSAPSARGLFSGKAVHRTPLRSLRLPLPYSPDPTPIEMASARLEAVIRRAAARTYDDPWRVTGQVCGLFTDEACYNVFKAAGYDTD